MEKARAGRWPQPTRARAGTALLVVASACDGGPVIRPIAGAPITRSGNLVTRPVIFATDDYYIAPEKTEAEQGRLRVPERRDSATGRSFEIHFIRFKSTATKPSYPIIYLAGGPGGSGSGSAAGDRFPVFMHLRKAADVVALDQRGVAHSTPTPVCPGRWEYPLAWPLDETKLREIIGPWLRRCAEHIRDSVDIAAFNAKESADDIEDLRKALGAEKVSLWGISYGTHLGLAYMRKYPGRVHRAILAGVEGPDHTWKLPARVEASLRRLDSTVAADKRVGDRVGELIPRLRETVARLAAQPAVGNAVDRRTKQTHRVTVGPLDLQQAVYFAQGERESIELLLTRLADILDGRYDALAQFAYNTRTENTELVMALSTDCAAGATAQRQALIASQAQAAVLGDVANLALRVRCPFWPVPDLGDSMRMPFSSDAGVLAISGTLDNRTPPDNAEEVLRHFPNAHHLVIDGASHDDDLFLSHKEIRNAMLRFLQTGNPGVSRLTLKPIRFKVP
jgi:pimeloyl-ACP methyl ester carboxylesterase